jgi:hypothetical protein
MLREALRSSEVPDRKVDAWPSLRTSATFALASDTIFCFFPA